MSIFANHEITLFEREENKTYSSRRFSLFPFLVFESYDTTFLSGYSLFLLEGLTSSASGNLNVLVEANRFLSPRDPEVETMTGCVEFVRLNEERVVSDEEWSYKVELR